MTDTSGSVTAKKPKARSRFLLGLLAGGIAASVLYAAVFYKRTPQRALWKVLTIVGLRESDDLTSVYAYGGYKSMTAADAWHKVKSVKSPLWYVRPGYDVQQVATGFTFPVRIAFAQKPGTSPDSPSFYVNELHGTIKYVTRGGQVMTYAEGLLNFKSVPRKNSDETGLSGLLALPDSEDLIVTGTYMDHASGLLRNRIMRLVSEPGGRRMKELKVLLDIPEFTCPSNQIQQVLLGPDGKLYVSVGDAENSALSMDFSKFAGKILRMNLDGSACTDNPFYEPSARQAPRSYIYAYGLRNVFDFGFDPETQHFYGVDNGKSADRLVHVQRGGGYAWNGRNDANFVNALYAWTPTVSPCGMVILRQNTLGSGTQRRMLVATYGYPAAPPPSLGKKILEFQFDPERPLLARVPMPLIEYAGSKKTTVLGLAEGTDGLYFTDFFGETEREDRYCTGAGSIWKVVPSKETADLPDASLAELMKLSPYQRGALHFSTNCMPCHQLRGAGGLVGPDLTGLPTKLDRLHYPAYAAQVQELMKSQQSYFVEQQPRMKEVLAAQGEARKRVWLKHHIEEPRFDNPFATMPSFQSLPQEHRRDLMEFLLSEKNK